MQCIDCENNIEEAVLSLPGIIQAKASFTEECLELILDADAISIKTVYAAIKNVGYSCHRRPVKSISETAGHIGLITVGAIGIVLLLELNQFFQIESTFQGVGETVDYSLLFIVGILTSFHCIGMCGSFVLSYTIDRSQEGRSLHFQHFSYGLGKVISYTAFGAIFGLIGSAISFTVTLRCLVLMVSGVFLVIYGLSMLDRFHSLRRYQIRLPHFMFHALAEQRRHVSNPLLIGLLNGLMIACGPLQAMYIAAAGSGSAVQGAAMLAVFALGTLPVMLAFGYLSSVITANITHEFLRISSLIIVILGVVMINRGLTLSGSGYDAYSLWSKSVLTIDEKFLTWQKEHGEIDARIQAGYQVIYMEVEPNAYIPATFTLHKNLPVKWIINVRKVSTCNRQIVIPSLSMTIDLKSGLQMVEFVPEQTGVISWSCYMGMIPGTFIVMD